MEKTIKTPNRPKVKLVGTDGNAFELLGRCQQAARKAKWDKEVTAAVLDEAMAGDYDHLLATLVTYFEVR